jgi:hypothetical protein
MTVAVASLGCDRKAAEGFPSWPTLFELDGDYSLYLNYEAQREDTPGLRTAHRVITSAAYGDAYADCVQPDLEPKRSYSLDVWTWGTFTGLDWRKHPAFDQDQARLSSIVTARSMCIEFALQTNASHLLFIDADIIPPKDIIPKMLEVNRDAVCGLVYGRGAHSACPYIFGEKRRWNENGYELVEVEHGNVGFCLLSRKLFEAVRFRYGRSIYPDGRDCMTSDDPAYHLDCFLKFGQWPVVRMDVVGTHVGDLKADQTSQY